MPRINRVDVGNIVYHVLNRANARITIFATSEDFQLFENVLKEGKEKFNMRILSYCIMPNHWHLILYPRYDGHLRQFMGWVSMTHTQRRHSLHKSTGSGHLYQGRYKSFPVETNEYLLQLFRYVERNALKAKLIKRAEQWQWSSLWRREYGNKDQKVLLSEWPIETPDDYLELVNNPQTVAETESLRYCINKSKPFGGERWTNKMLDRFNLHSTVRGRGRPKKGS